MAKTSVSVVFPYSRANYIDGTKATVSKFTLYRSEYKHELAEIEILGSRGRDLGLRSNAPVKAVALGNSAFPLTFVGYVHGYTEIDSNTVGAVDHPTHRVLAVGATYPLKTGANRTWSNTTLSQIAYTIATKWNLQAEVEPSNIIIKRVHQAGESDWSFLCRVARQYGFVVYAQETTLYVHSRNYQNDAKSLTAHRFSAAKAGSGLARMWDYEVDIVDTASHGEGAHTNRVISNVDAKTGQVITWGNNGQPSVANKYVPAAQFLEYDHLSVAANLTEAAAKAAGAHERTRHTYRLHCHMSGRTDLVPTSKIHVQGMANGYDGYWSAIEIEHRLTPDHYSMKVVAGTNSLGDAAADAPPSNNRPVLSRPFNRSRLLVPAGTQQPTQALIVGGPPLKYRWVAQTAGRINFPPAPTLTVRRTITDARISPSYGFASGFEQLFT